MMTDPAVPTIPAPEEAKKREDLSAFTLNLLKAMLKSGYYAPEHPGSRNAKEGLFREFLSVLEGKDALTYIRREDRVKRDVLVEGFSDDLLSLSSVITMGASELFIPKFLEYFARQNLVSFSFKAGITQSEFEKFVDIMSETPKKELGKEELGQALTRKILENDIVHVSTIFDVDLIGMTRKLPWRVELVITRLKKDLSLIPLFRSYKKEALEETKAKVIGDIIRPLHDSDTLKDFLVNCDLVCEDLKNIGQLDIEAQVFESLQPGILIKTVKALQDEFEKSQALLELSEDNEVARVITERSRGLLKKVSVRLVRDNIPEGLSILLSLHSKEILSMADLSEEARNVVIAKKMTDGFLKDEKKFLDGLKTVKDGGVLKRYMDQLLRIMLELFERDLHVSGLRIINVLFDLSEKRNLENELISEKYSKIILPRLKHGFLSAPKEAREEIARALIRFGKVSVPYLIDVLRESEDKRVRNSASTAVAVIGPQAGETLLKELTDTKQPWYFHRNLIGLLGKIKFAPAVPVIEKYAAHEDARVREAAIESLALLRGREAEPLIVKALTDPEAKIKNRAFVLLKSFKCSLPVFARYCLGIIARREANAEEENEEIQLLACSALSVMEGMTPELRAEAEETLRRAVEPEDKSMLKMFKKKKWKDKSPKVQAAINDILTKLGTK